MKPGQTDLRGDGIYAAVVASAVGRDETFLATERSDKSEYSRNHGHNTRSSHYAEYKKAPNRWATRTVYEGDAGTSNWRSEYNSKLNRGVVEAANEDQLAGGNPRMLFMGGQKPNVLGRAEDMTSYRTDFGRYGSNPRDLVAAGATTLPIFKSVLNAGTVKVSDHVPGYQGHVPTGSLSARAEQSFKPRSVDKTNVVEVFHRNVVGYAGHVPMSARNDRGGFHPTTETVSGRDYVPHVRRVSKLANDGPGQ